VKRVVLVSPNVELWNSLFELFLVFGSTIAVLVLGYMVYLVIKNRSSTKSVKESGSSKRFVLVLFVIMCVVGSTLYVSLEEATPFYYNPPSGPKLVVRVYAYQWGWNFTYQNGKSLVDLLIVPVNTTIVLNITSKDVMHSLGIPMLDVKADAIPGFWNTLWFLVTTTGNYTSAIRCYELCGAGHSYMLANLDVVTQKAFYEWYNS